MQVSTHNKLALGAVLGTFGALGTVLAPLLGLTTAPRPWGFLVGFAVGLLAGLGGTLAVVGLIEGGMESRHPRRQQWPRHDTHAD